MELSAWVQIVTVAAGAIVLVVAAVALTRGGVKVMTGVRLGASQVVVLVERLNGKAMGGYISQGGVKSRDYGPLAWLPKWAQTGAVLPDGNVDPQEWSDCGEVCVAAIVAAVHGVPVEAGSVRQMLGGSARSGLTTGADLVRALQYYNVAAHELTMSATVALHALQTACSMALPTIILGRFAPNAVLHWLLVCGFAEDGLHVCDPLLGAERVVTYDDFRNCYAGSIVEGMGHCHYDMSAVGTPGANG